MGIPVQTFRQSGDSLQKGLDRADVVAEQGSAGEGLPSSKREGQPQKISVLWRCGIATG